MASATRRAWHRGVRPRRSRRSAHIQRYGASQSSSWTSGSRRSPYQRRGPSTRTVTSPASRSTRRCFDVSGWVSPSASASSPTSCSPSRSRSRIDRRIGCASTSNVVSTHQACHRWHMPCKAHRSRRVRCAVRCARSGRSRSAGSRWAWANSGVIGRARWRSLPMQTSTVARSMTKSRTWPPRRCSASMKWTWPPGTPMPRSYSGVRNPATTPSTSPSSCTGSPLVTSTSGRYGRSWRATVRVRTNANRPLTRTAYR